jgi:threonine/homoserine/homoserine lactone efflux protein
VIVVIPGPSVMFVIGRSLALGRRGGLLSVVGNVLGFIPQVTAVALGIGVVVAQSMVLFSIIKFAGGAYLVYLGGQAIRHRLALVSEEDGVSSATQSGPFRQASFATGLRGPRSGCRGCAPPEAS